MKRRKVFRVMAVYGATAFVLLQVADLLADGMGLSDQVLRVTTFLVLIGFPIAIVLAWAFETTPEGVRRTAPADPEEISDILTQPASRRWPAGLLALAGVVLLLAGWRMGQQGRPNAALNLVVPQVAAADFRRIAVLPFEDLGGNEENDPFVSGLQVDVHGKLSRLQELRVTSLGSVRDYATTAKSAREIASELAVDYLVRGGVRRSGDHARVNVQLTDVARNEDIWVEQFDQQVTAQNLFAIQTDIARTIADHLEAELSPATIEYLEAGLSTDNLDAINAYYRARSLAESGFDVDDFTDASSHAERAVRLAPEFVEAWSLIASLRSGGAPWAGVEMAARAHEAVMRTEALAPGSLEAIKARAWYTYKVEADFERSLEMLRAAQSEDPSNVEVLQAIAWTQRRLGQFTDAVHAMKRAVALDPQNPSTLTALGSMLESMSMWDAESAVTERALAIDPSFVPAQWLKVSRIAQGDRDPGRALRVAAEFGMDPWPGLAWIAALDRDYDRAARLLASESLPRDFENWRVFEFDRLIDLAWVEAERGGDPGPVRDSLAALFADYPQSLEPDEAKGLKAAVLLLAGQEEAGWAVLEERVNAARSSADVAGRVDTYWRSARLYAQFDRREEALALLDEAVARPSDNVWSLADLELDSRFDSLHDDPRFDILVARQAAYELEQASVAEAEGPWLL